MLAWYRDMEQLVQLPHMSKSQRQTFLASHAPDDFLDRNGSSSPGLDEDEADEIPYNQTDHSSVEESISPPTPKRPEPGGSFPSETKLDGKAIYGRSRTESDATHPPLRISLEEPHEGFRPVTSETQNSMGDENQFTATVIGVTAATIIPISQQQTETEDAQVLENRPISTDSKTTVNNHTIPLSPFEIGSSFSLSPSTSAIQRSKSRREIVEQVIAEASGNHPELGKLPGIWPATPIQEVLNVDGSYL